jgi:hypothetical protein
LLPFENWREANSIAELFSQAVGRCLVDYFEELMSLGSNMNLVFVLKKHKLLLEVLAAAYPSLFGNVGLWSFADQKMPWYLVLYDCCWINASEWRSQMWGNEHGRGVASHDIIEDLYKVGRLHNYY